MVKDKRMKIVGVAIMTVLLLVLPFLVTRYILNIVIMAGIWILLSSSLNVMLGYAGQLSMGHTAFYGIGAYVSGIMSVKLGTPIWLGMPLAGVVSSTVGYGISRLTFRVRGSSFVLVTLGFGEVMRLIANNWMDLTNGPMGIQGISRPDIMGFIFNFNAYYYFILVLNVIALYIFWRLERSRFGRALISLNENEALANAIGIESDKYLTMATVMSTFFAGIAGSFYAHYVTFISPDMFSLSNTITMVIMVVVGGKRTISGPVVGALVFTLLLELLRPLENYRMLIYGGILMLTILFMKNGIVPHFVNLFKQRGGTTHENSRS